MITISENDIYATVDTCMGVIIKLIAIIVGVLIGSSVILVLILPMLLNIILPVATFLLYVCALLVVTLVFETNKISSIGIKKNRLKNNTAA